MSERKDISIKEQETASPSPTAVEEDITAQTVSLDLISEEASTATEIPEVVTDKSSAAVETTETNAGDELREMLYAEFLPDHTATNRNSDTPAAEIAKAIRIKDLCKDYRVGWAQHRKYRALDGISFDINAGEIFGFLGPNGAGKTTTIKALLGITRPTSGTIEIFGEKGATKEVRRHIGYFPEISYYHKYLTAQEAVAYYGRLCGLSGRRLKERAKTLLEITGIYQHRNKQLKTFSKGMLQRVGLAQALVNDPALLIMDEPTAGLDPLMKKEMRDLILYLNSQGKTVFFSSHELSEVEMICHRVAILYKGKIITEGALNEILPTQTGFMISVKSLTEEAKRQLSEAGITVKKTNEGISIQCNDSKTTYWALERLGTTSSELAEVQPIRQTLEDFFVNAIKEEGGEQ